MGDGEGRFLVTLIKVFFLSEMPNDFNKKKKRLKIYAVVRYARPFTNNFQHINLFINT